MGRAIVNKSSSMETAGPADSYLKKGGSAKMKKGGKTSTKMMYGGMKKGGTKKGM